MVEKLQRKLRDSARARWLVLILVSFTMMTGYIINYTMSPLDTMLRQELGWDMSDYGTFTGFYGVLNVFLLMLIFSGMILDRKGPRFTGILAIIIMVAGTSLEYWAMSSDFGGALTNILGWQLKTQVLCAMLGFAVFGVGLEMVGITAQKIVVKWFSGHSLALAMGLNTAAGRVGTAIALTASVSIAKYAGHVSAPLFVGIMLLFVGLVTFIIFIMVDRKADREQNNGKLITNAEMAPEERFHVRDIFSIARIRGFWYIAFLCVLFYAAVFPFIDFASGFMVQKFGISTRTAGLFPALIPFGNILLTPLFGSIYDRKGRGATIMIIGAGLLTFVHLIFAIPGLTYSWVAIVLMLLLGAAFSLVPSAMWPSMPKIVPYRQLGTAYALTFWIQNWGLMGVPMLMGWVLNKYCIIGEVVIDGITTQKYDYTLPILIFACFGILSVVVAFLIRSEDRKKGFGLQLPNNTVAPKH